MSNLHFSMLQTPNCCQKLTYLATIKQKKKVTWACLITSTGAIFSKPLMCRRGSMTRTPYSPYFQAFSATCAPFPPSKYKYGVVVVGVSNPNL